MSLSMSTFYNITTLTKGTKNNGCKKKVIKNLYV